MTGPTALLFRAERIKLRRSWSLLAATLTPLSLAAILLQIFWFSEDRVRPLGAGFQAWYQVTYAAWDLFFLPILIALVGVLSWEAEAEAGSWKHLLLQPVPRWRHFVAKLMGNLSLALLAQLLFALMLLLGGGILRAEVPTLAMGAARPGLLLGLAGASTVATLPLVGLHTWLPMRFPGMGVSLSVAMLGSWLAFRFAGRFAVALLLPWGPASRVVDVLVKGEGPVWAPALAALACAAVLMVLGGRDFVRRESFQD